MVVIVDEYGDKFEGDMVLSKEQRESLFPLYRCGLIGKDYRWPNKTVPYNLTNDHSERQQKQIVLAMREIELVSCVKFIPRTNEKHYIQFTVSLSGIEFI